MGLVGAGSIRAGVSRRTDTVGKKSRSVSKTLAREHGPENANHVARLAQLYPTTDSHRKCFVPVAHIEQALPAIHLHSA